MKKLFAGIVLMLAMSVCAALADGFILPSCLTVIEADAFRDDARISGVLEIPSGVTRIESDAFTGTGLYALSLPEGVSSMGTQALRDAAYVYVRGSDTTLSSLSGVRYLIAPENSAA